LLPPPKGSVLTFDTKSAIATYWLPGWPLRGWMDWAGRRLCRPPAGLGNGRAPAGALRGGKCGPRGLDPYREVGGRLGEPALRGGCRFGAHGLGASMKLKRLIGESGWQNPTTGWLADPDRRSLSGGGCAPEKFLPHISNAKSR
jgi:hypothetical protein